MRKMDNNLMDINQLIKAEKTEDIVSDLKKHNWIISETGIPSDQYCFSL